MADHPAAHLLAPHLGRLQHTNAHGEVGYVCIPGFMNTVGMSEEQAGESGALALAISEGVIETLEQLCGQRVVPAPELKSLRRRAAEADHTTAPEPDPATCKRCGKPVIRFGPKIDVGVVIVALQEHQKVCL